MKKTNNKKKKLMIDTAIMVVLAGIITLVVFALSYKKETHIYESINEGDTLALVCTSHDNDSEKHFFTDDYASNVEHRLKLVYRDGVVGKLSYEYTGEYNSEEAAREAKGNFNTKYNIYIGDHNLELNVLSPVFQHSNNKVKVELYLDDYRNLNSVIGKLFYISSASLDSVIKNSKEETKKYYEKKGFSCIIND